MIKFVVAFLLALLAHIAAVEEPSLRGAARTLKDWQLGDWGYNRSQSVAGNYYIGGATTGSRLKLFWKQGDYWHHQYNELFLCMLCHSVAMGGSGCEKDDDLHIETCATNSTNFTFNTASSGSVQLHVAGSDLCVELSSTGAFQPVTLQICNATSPTQYFSSGQGSFATNQFELVANDGWCLSNTHHPKEGEYIYAQNCAKPRAATASIWVKY
jgi:hypothetical protein